MTFVNHYMLADLEIPQNLSGREGGRNHLYCHGFQGNVVGSGVTDRDGRLIVPG